MMDMLNFFRSVSPVVLAQLLIQFQRPPSNLVAPSNETSTASPDTLDYDAPEELYTETPIINCIIKHKNLLYTK